MDSFEISLFDKIDGCYVCGHDAPVIETYKDDFATVIYDNPFYLDRSYGNPLFLPTLDIHDNEEFCIENLYDNALDDGPMLLNHYDYDILESGLGRVSTLISSPTSLESDQSFSMKVKSVFGRVSTLGRNPTILELDRNYVLVGHEKHALCDSYIIDFVHDAIENYFERGKFGCRNFHVTKHLSYDESFKVVLLLPTYACYFVLS